MVSCALLSLFRHTCVLYNVSQDSFGCSECVIVVRLLGFRTKTKKNLPFVFFVCVLIVVLSCLHPPPCQISLLKARADNSGSVVHARLFSQTQLQRVCV